MLFHVTLPVMGRTLFSLEKADEFSLKKKEAEVKLNVNKECFNF
jgi:hypothetical protein